MNGRQAGVGQVLEGKLEPSLPGPGRGYEGEAVALAGLQREAAPALLASGFESSKGRSRGWIKPSSRRTGLMRATGAQSYAETWMSRPVGCSRY